jgi:hypothetical protein
MDAELPLIFDKPRPKARRVKPMSEELAAFCEFGEKTRTASVTVELPDKTELAVPCFINEYWTPKQRDASRLHEISYRACFKPQLPRFFIERLTDSGDMVYDPFMGRGTTPLEAALLGRLPFGNDVNPLSAIITRPRLNAPALEEIHKRLAKISLEKSQEWPEDLLVFYHPETLKEIIALKEYFLRRMEEGTMDAVDEWIRMVSVNRLTGHSSGFFSVYTLPPNQAVSIKSQIKINAKRNQIPPKRDIREIILKKSRKLLSDCDAATRHTLQAVASQALLLTGPADQTASIPSDSVKLVVTSPPFLDIVDYASDNWLRCWFAGIDPSNVKLTVPKKLDVWQVEMTRVFHELHRVLKPGGHIAFEVGEVSKGKIRLEEAVLRCGHAAGLKPILVLINDQEFTKTANCWGVDNNEKGTNTNRIVLFEKNQFKK